MFYQSITFRNSIGCTALGVYKNMGWIRTGEKRYEIDNIPMTSAAHVSSSSPARQWRNDIFPPAARPVQVKTSVVFSVPCSTGKLKRSRREKIVKISRTHYSVGVECGFSSPRPHVFKFNKAKRIQPPFYPLHAPFCIYPTEIYHAERPLARHFNICKPSQFKHNKVFFAHPMLFSLV